MTEAHSLEPRPEPGSLVERLRSVHLQMVATEHGMYGYPEQFIPETELIGYGAMPADTKGYSPDAAPVRAATAVPANRDGVTA